jgi:predicted nucleotidyltransferase component of viral defense system
MDTGKLRPDTRRLWERLDGDPLLRGFVLIGGTALAMRIGHRVSEDLDFAYLGDLLPKQRLKQIGEVLRKDGFHFELNQDVLAEQEFIDSGLLLEDHQQNYLADGSLKVSFVRFDNATTQLLNGDSNSSLRVATLDEIFKTKALVCRERSKTRDWFDLYILMTRHGYAMTDFYRTYEEADCERSFDMATVRLRSCTPSIADEGYLHLLENAPTLGEMREYFNRTLDEFEVEMSRTAFKASKC